jgi:hypothetical protein
MLRMRRVVKSLLPDSLHAGALRVEDRLRVAGAGLIAWRRQPDDRAAAIMEAALKGID